MFGRKNNSHNYWRRLIIYALGFVLAISVALPAYIQSNFLEQYINIELVSIFFVAANIITAIAIGFFPRVIRRLGSYFTAKLLILIYGSALIALVATNGPLSAALSLLLFIIASNLIWINIDILLESASVDNQTGRIRTIYLTFMNLGWIVAPTISASLVNWGGYPFSFLASASLVLPLFIIIAAQKNYLQDKRRRYRREELLKSWKKLWKNRDLRSIFIAAISLNLFFSGAVLYIPLYLHQTLSMPWSQLGWIFSFMLIPFVLFEIPAGWAADKYIGEKELLFLGLFILILSLLLFSFLKTSSPWIWAFALFFSRVGSALIESMRDTYFFKQVSDKDVGLINVFRMTGPIGYALGATLASLTILFLPLNYVFIVFAIIITPSLYFTLLIKDTK